VVGGSRAGPQQPAEARLLTADGQGTNAMTRVLGKHKTVVWCWQARFMQEGVAGLTRDKTRHRGSRRCQLRRSIG
jgi:hypothetical protein